MINLLTIPNQVKIRVEGKLYKQDVRYTDFKKGDLVLDMLDLRYGTIHDIMCSDDTRFAPVAALRDGCVTEIGVTFDRLVKLQPMNKAERVLHSIHKFFIELSRDSTIKLHQDDKSKRNKAS